MQCTRLCQSASRNLIYGNFNRNIQDNYILFSQRTYVLATFVTPKEVPVLMENVCASLRIMVNIVMVSSVSYFITLHG